VPAPQLVVFDVIGRYAVLAAQVHQQDWCPQQLHAGTAAAAAAGVAPVGVEEGGEGVDGHGVAAQVGQPDEEPQQTWDSTLTKGREDEEEPLDDEARDDEDAQLVFLPELQGFRETGRIVLSGLTHLSDRSRG